MAQYDLNLREYWRVVKKRKYLILLTVVLTGLFSFVFALISRPAPIYKATASVRMERIVRAGLFNDPMADGYAQTVQAQAQTAKSFPLLEKAAQRLGLLPGNLSPAEIRANQKYLEIVTDLKNKVEAEADPAMAIIHISVASSDPRLSQRLANTIADVLREERLREVNRKAADTRAFIESQLKIARDKLKASEEAVREFKEKNKLISLDAQTSAILGQLNSYQVSYDKAELALQKIGEVKRVLAKAESNPLASKTSFFFEEAPGIYKSLNDKLVQLMVERDTLLMIYTENYPQVVELKNQIREIVASMIAQLDHYEKTLGNDIRSLKARVDQMGDQARRLPEKGLELARLDRQIQLNTEVYTLLEKRHQEALILEAEKVEDVQIIRPALLPATPANRSKTTETATAGVLIGLILGLLLVFLAETFDTSMGAVEEIESLLGVHTLGLVPHIGQQEILETLKEKYAGDVEPEVAERGARLVSHFAPKSRLAESYRAIRTSLAFACLERDVKSIVVTSSTPQEGKTTSIVNLAITLSQGGSRVLLIEGDLRKPMISRMFGIDHAPGLTDVLLGNFEWRKITRTISDIMTGTMSMDEILTTPGIENLHIIASGTIPPNPAEIVYSKALDAFMQQARAEYDYVLIDAPPLLAATDAVLLAAKADAVVMVYRVGKIPRGILKRAKAQLDNIKANVIGVILNGMRADLSSDYADYKYKYYYDDSTPMKPETVLDKIRAAAGTVVHIVRQVDDGKVRKISRDIANRGRSIKTVRHILRGTGETDGTSAQSTGPFPAPAARGARLWKTGILLAAILFLIAGILYQMGYVKPPAPVLHAQRIAVQSPSQNEKGAMAGKEARPIRMQREAAGVHQTEQEGAVLPVAGKK
ncbi:MAG TPA: polysaccharide biosynthesis tyrosine autokinase [Syntrophales bacterium]|jgi:capsular exopolysaccharide synthesis family protein|nr:polysaccharide biosynthesis tyrosine autokinase [Syntrophobacterales bacterium]HOS77184.1 polysaccharide biosynthesis tyrosine autokinase [Syntrophales bacterium]HQN17486.1 polysaccharide biosynthesis tyrosine autokinase [Syntrophobacteraceae bacterium]